MRARVAAFAEHVLSRDKWRQFSIWGAGRDARDFVNALAKLDASLAKRITAMHDVAEAKLGVGVYVNGGTGAQYPVRAIDQIQPPFVCCVALYRYYDEDHPESDLVAGAVRRKANELDLQEGDDYWHFN